jgi:UDP-N-acetylmuramoylalanine--D-glutamate ligase
VGLGKSGVASAGLLNRLGCRVRVTDARRSSALETWSDSLQVSGVEAVELGGHTAAFIDASQLVVVSPGVPESSEPVQWALARSIPIISEVELAFHFCPSPIVAVTGTNGKSTTVTLIARVLNAARRSAVACGNIGVPFSSILDQLTPSTVAVVEVSSFQLLWCHRFRPRIGVLLNLGTNHLDRHHDPNAYLAAKARLFARQTSEDYAVLNGADPRIVEASEAWQAQRIWFGENRSNPPVFHVESSTSQSLTASAQAVLQVGRLFDIPDPLTWQVLRSARPLEHRLESVATIRGVHFVNDSKSTTPESLLFALMQTRGDVVVILGGRDKALDFTGLVEPLHAARVKGLVFVGESRARLRALLNGSPAAPSRECASLEDAVQAATALAAPGTTVLFSPACASFDMFRDFEERGRIFKAIVQGLKPRQEGG